jgi:outer membrane receptor protein involved in Fe transport
MNETRFITMGATQHQGFFVNPMYLGRRRTGDDKQIVYTVKGDLTSQVNSANLMKMGFEFKKMDLFKDHTSIASGGNDYNDQFHVKPFQIGAYAQNKLESEGMIMNLGLRFDFFDPKTVVPANLEDPLLQEYLDDPQNVETMFELEDRLKGAVEAKTKQQISPRVGISYPITERDVLHVTYGHYFQLPQLYYLYQNIGYDLRGAHKYMGSPDLEPEKTIAYEAGLEHGFNDFLKLSVTGFYKDITNLVTYHKTFFGNAFYWLYSNSDYARVKGFEFTLTQRPWHGLSGVVTYTYQIARGRASDGYQTFQDDYDNRKPRTEDFPLDWDQRHTARINLNYRVPGDWGPAVNNYHFLGDWGIDFFWTYGSGTPYTSSISVPQPEIPPMNDKLFPEAWRIDMRFDKSFKIYKTYKTNFFVEIRNLTDRANLNDEYPEFDAERYELTGEPGGQFGDPDVYSTPRRILLGMEFVF